MQYICRLSCNPLTQNFIFRNSITHQNTPCSLTALRTFSSRKPSLSRSKRSSQRSSSIENDSFNVLKKRPNQSLNPNSAPLPTNSLLDPTLLQSELSMSPPLIIQHKAPIPSPGIKNQTFSFTNRDSLLHNYAILRRDRTGNHILTFKQSASNLKSVVHSAISGATTKKIAVKYSFDDLFYVRHVLRNILEESKTMKRSNEENEEEEETIQKKIQNLIDEEVTTECRRHWANANAPPEGLKELLDWIDYEATERMEAAEKLLKKGQVNFDGLSVIFKPEAKIVGKSMDTGSSPVGYQVISSKYQIIKGLEGKFYYFQMKMIFIVSNGTSFLLINHFDTIDQNAQFPSSNLSSSISISSLLYQPLTAEMEQNMIERGRRYVEYSVKPHYLAYDSDSFSYHLKKTSSTAGHGISTDTFLRVKGRVMVDIDVGRRLGHHSCSSRFTPGSTVIEMVALYHQQKNQQMKYRSQDSFRNPHSRPDYQPGSYIEMQTVPENLLMLCWPAVTGFSFTAKAWGHVLVDSLSPIKFDDNAFHQLVLANERKSLIQAIVNHSEGVFKDIISGKGGGSVFLLYGPPGTGKTLTSEAVAEMLHRPLYSVSMGELGTNPTELETNLKEILELASIWKALVLMDEADIFLERRGHKEIVRNAMVGVIMRLIEYYQGVLFLTSNRVDTFDEAVHSRITVALKYETLTEEIRKNVWEMLLKAANIDGVDASLLCTYPLNGRQIKNCINLSQGLAKAEESKVTMKHLNQVIKVTMEFVEEIASHKRIVE